jgi:hypothetical protein
MPTLSPAPDDPTPSATEAPVPTPSPTPTPTATPKPVLFAPSEPGGFTPVLGYEYTVPEGWTATTAASEISIVHSNGLLKVSLSELPLDRRDFASFSQVVQSIEPVTPPGWSEWTLSNSEPLNGGSVYQYTFNGVRSGRGYVSVVEWQLWGEVLVQARIEAEAETWASNSKLRNESLLIMSTFVPSETGALSEVDALRQLLKARFGFFRSGIYLVDQQGFRQELSCRDVFLQLLTDPVYIGDGVWQVHAIGDRGAQVWLVYEPDGTIVPVSSNTSKC